MRIFRSVIGMIVLFILATTARGQASGQPGTIVNNQEQEAAIPANSSAQPVIWFPALPTVKGTSALLGDCLYNLNDELIKAGSGIFRETGGTAYVNSGLRLQLALYGPTQAWSVKCGADTTNGLDTLDKSGTAVKVWTADESKKQLELLQTQAESAIKILNADIRSLADANDALTRRINELEAQLKQVTQGR